MSNLLWLNEAQMARLRPFFPKSRGRPSVDDLRFLSGIILINRNGLRWCDAPVDTDRPRPFTIAGNVRATSGASLGS